MPLKTILVGFLIGSVVSIPIGMLGMFMLNCAIQYGRKIGIAIGCMSALLDSLYCAIAMTGYSLAISPRVAFFVQLAAFVALIYMGIRPRIGKNEHESRPYAMEKLYDRFMPNRSRLSVKVFSRVLMIACLNPMPFVFWLNVGGLLQNAKLMSGHIHDIAEISAGVGIGSLMTQAIFLSLVHRLQSHYSSLGLYLKRIGLVASALTIFACGVNIIREIATRFFG